jgi:hypothetical protein
VAKEKTIVVALGAATAISSQGFDVIVAALVIALFLLFKSTLENVAPPVVGVMVITD